MARILVVSDNPTDYRTLEAAVAGQPHHIQHTASGLDGCLTAVQVRPDVVLVGEHTTDQDGLAVIRHLRHNLDVDSLLVMPLSEDSADKRIAAYEAGVDDTLPRPLNVAEVGLRLKALLRQRQQPMGDCLTIGALRLDRDARLLYVDGRPSPLTPREYALLEMLMTQPGKTFSAEELLDAVWGLGTTANVRVTVACLRRKVGSERIANVPGFGYRVVT